MPHKKPRYENIINTPAHELMKLSFEELHTFELVARKAEEEANSIRHWIIGIRTEKSIRLRKKDEGTIKSEGIALHSSLSGMLGRSPFNEEEISQLRCRAWQEQGLLIIDLWNLLLTPSEVQMLSKIGKRLYPEGGQK